MQISQVYGSAWYLVTDGLATARINGISMWTSLESLFDDIQKSKDIIWEHTGFLEVIKDNITTISEFKDFNDLKEVFAEYFI